MGLKEDVLALAEELDGVSVKENCEACLASGTELCRGDLECAESAHKACAKRLREIVEHDECEVTTISAYDLLPDDDREALAWVREHGGLESVKKLLDWVVGHCSTKQQLDFDFWLSGRVMYELGFEEDMADRDEVERRLLARLMPEGMEWPKVDGEPVVIGERMRSCGIEDCKVVGIDPANARLFLAFNDIEKGKAIYFPDLAKDCHRPAPKALDADGVEICVGDRLYDTDTGCGRTVRAVNDNGTVEFDGHENRGWFGCFLTHRAPVLAADGKPLREGEHVCHVETGAELVVKELPKPGEYQAVVVFAPPASHPTSFDPDQLTHQRPVLDADGVPIREGDTVYVLGFGEPLTVKDFTDDGRVLMSFHDENSLGYKPSKLTHERPESWERLEEDAGKNPFDYCKDVGHRLDTCENAERFKARDIVRRAKALAERERSE